MEEIGLVAIFDVRQFNKGLDTYVDGVNEANNATKQAGDDSFSFTRALEVFVGNALVKVGELALEAAGKVIEFGKESVALAADFETQMSILQTAAADSGKSVDELGEIMIAVGGDSRILGASATGAADAATNLFKAGLKTEAVMSNLNEFMEDGAKLTGALASSFDLAAATGLEVGRASEIAAINLATFGGELKTGAEQADFIQFSLDNLVKAADASVAEVADLSEALAVVGPSANAAGLSFQDTTNALALFSTAGITGSRAGTTLEATLRDLRKTTPKAQEMMDKLNISLYDQEGAMLPLIDIVGQFEQATADMTQEQRDQSLQAIFQAQGMRGIQVLLGSGIEGWNDMADAVEGATGIQEQAELRSKTFAGQMESLDGQIETLKIRFGQALLPILSAVIRVFSSLIEQHGPAIEKVFEKIGSVVDWLAGVMNTNGDLWNDALVDLPEPLREFVEFLTETLMPRIEKAWSAIQSGIITILPIFQAIWGAISKVIEVAVGTIGETLMPDLIGAFEAIKAFDWEAILKVITTVGIVIGAVFTTVLGVVVGVVKGVAAGLKKAAELFKDITESINKVFKAFAEKDIKKGIKEFGKLIIKGITLPFKVIFKVVQEFVKGFLKFFENLRIKLVGRSIIPDMMKAIFTTIKNVFDDIIKIVREWINNVISFFEDLARDVIAAWVELWDDVKRVIDDAVKKVEKFIVDLIDTVTRAWDDFVEDIENAWDTLWDNVKSAIDTAITNIESAIAIFVGNIERVWNTFTSTIETAWNTLWTNVQTAITTAFVNIVTAVSTGMQNILDAITGFAQDLIDKGAEIVQWISDGISGAWDILTTAVSDLITNIGTAITNAKDKILEFGSTIVEFIRDGLTTAWTAAGGLVDAISDKFGDLKEDLGTAWIKILDVGGEIIEKIKKGLIARWDVFKNAFADLLTGDTTGIMHIINSVKQNFLDAGGQFVEFLKLGISNAWDGFVQWIKDKLIGWFTANPPASGSNQARRAEQLTQQGLISPIGNTMTNNNNFDNSRNITIEINSTNAPQEPTQIYFDVVAALSAVGS